MEKKDKNYILKVNPNLLIECPEKKSGEVRKRLLQSMRASKKKDALADEKKRLKIKAMCLQKI